MKMRINPSVQLGVSFLLSIVILFTKSWKLNGAMMLASIVLIVLFRQQPWGRVVLSVYFYPNENLLVQTGSSGVLSVALELSSRILSLGLVGISLSTSIEKNEFVASLIQQLKVPVAIAYSILVAINFLTLIQTEYEQSKLALQIRGISGSGVYLKALTTMMIRLMRQSEYTAIAMELRGFSPDRVQKIQLEISILDLIYSSLMISFIVIVIWLQQ